MSALNVSAFFTPRRRQILGMILHVIATQFFLLSMALGFLAMMEIWKGIELLEKVRNAWFTFGGARELFGYVVLAYIAGRLIDVYAKQLHPKLKHNPERGWHYPH